MQISKKILAEVRALFSIKSTKTTWAKAALTAISVGIPLLLGLYFDNVRAGLTACISGLVILYLPNTGSFTNKISTLLISSFGFILSFAIGQFFSFSHLASIIAFGVYSMLIHLILLQYKTAPPRSFFFIFITVLSICQPFDFNTIPEKVGLISLGLLLANFIILVHLLYLSTKANWRLEPQPIRIFQKTDYANFWEAITLGCFMAASLWCGYFLEMENPY
ncbi:hypothetical protein [Neotamlana nanhaiensis]|uniref:hypothetical protein n=1 Tax=Neotamlana nanhaiensis TaxID=1382798 RepID=UPI00069C7265|nr:hypothetical protein [Tamlana nanhaiensis]